MRFEVIYGWQDSYHSGGQLASHILQYLDVDNGKL